MLYSSICICSKSRYLELKPFNTRILIMSRFYFAVQNKPFKSQNSSELKLNLRSLSATH
jgi:hypothetical protein